MLLNTILFKVAGIKPCYSLEIGPIATFDWFNDEIDIVSGRLNSFETLNLVTKQSDRRWINLVVKSIGLSKFVFSTCEKEMIAIGHPNCNIYTFLWFYVLVIVHVIESLLDEMECWAQRLSIVWLLFAKNTGVHE